MPDRRLPRPTCLALALLLATVLAPQPSAHAGDDLPALVEAYEASVQPARERTEAGYQAQEDALEAIAVLRTEAARETLVRLVAKYADSDPRQTTLLLGALVRYGGARAVDMAIDWIEDRHDPLLLDRLHVVLAQVETPGGLAHLRGDALRGARAAVQVQILRALATRKDDSALPALLKMSRDENPAVRIEAVESLGLLGTEKARPLVQVFLRDPEPDLRRTAARALGRLGDVQAVPALIRTLEDLNPRVVETAATALGRLDDPRAIPALIQGLGDATEDLRLADAFTQALQRISGKAIHDDAELWRAWWAAVKDRRPFQKAEEKPGTRSVPGPRYFDFPVRSSFVVFVLDVSRSMGWNERLDTAKAQLLTVLDELPPTTYFNVIVFSQRAWMWKERLQPADRRNVKNARKWVRAQRPLLGTNTHGALKAAFSDPDVDTIFLLSDGHPSEGRITDPQLILGEVRSWNRLRDVRIHGIALLKGPPPAAYQALEDQDRSLWFMKALCEQNEGRFREIK